MSDLRRFPVSDEFILNCKTFCVILDRKTIFEILNYWFSNFGHVTTKDMEMSGMVVRIEWKHSRIAAGPASGRNRPLKSRNLGFGHIGTFFRSFWKFEKWEVPEKMLAIQSKLFLGGWNRSGVNRWPGGRAIPGNGPSPTRKAYRSRIEFAGYPIFDLARFGLQGPRVCPARRGTMVLGDRKTLGYSGTLRGNPPVS